jgi:predicted RNA binding protein YcfA (HicA-like mRNA interferase family)
MGRHDLYHMVREMLIDEGFEYIPKKGKGDHHQFKKEGRKITIPYALHDRHMATKILKQAGIQPR